jgi:hypothetical protein
MDWARILAFVTGMVDQDLLARLEYLGAENRILKAQLKGRLKLSEYWRWKSRSLGGRPNMAADLRALIRRMSAENPLWGAPRIHGDTTYYNELRTHRSLNKDAPVHRSIQHVGCIICGPVLGGLHHHYCRV